jgi:hypothetical protein
MISKRALVFLSLLFLVVLIWLSFMFRFDLQVVTNQEGYAVAYRLDRLNGQLRLIENDQWYPVVEGNPDDLLDQQAAPKDSKF